MKNQFDTSKPDPNTYWVEPGKLLAGEYPGAPYTGEARAKLTRFLQAGITSFVDLTMTGELAPYEPILYELASENGHRVQYRRFPIRDVDLPHSSRHMADILDCIDTAIQAGEVVYVHCWGGIGRTGTVVGCYLVRKGLSGEEALREVARRFGDMEKSWRCGSPETEEQMDYVRYWVEPNKR